MIPKKIHYFWFGGSPKSEFIKKCLKSWEILGYEIFEWNENNYDLTKHNYLIQNYNNKRWAFVSDFARLDILYNEGGIYLDTDVQVINKIPEKILETDCLLGFQFDCLLGSHFIGAKKNSKVIKGLLEIYDNYPVDKSIPNNHVFTDYFIDSVTQFKLNGKNQIIQHLDEKISIYEKSFFSCPKLINKGYALHLLDNSWTKKKSYKKKIQNIVKKIIGKNIYYNLLAYKALKMSPYFSYFKEDCGLK